MVKKLFFITLILVIVCMISACNNGIESNTNAIPEISVKVGNSEINAVVKSGVMESAAFENTELFQSIMNDDSITIPYVELGETIQIEFSDKTQSTCELMEYILREDGTLKYKTETIEAIDITSSNGTGSFILNENMWASASSDSRDYEPGATIRGFRLICKGADKIEEHVFIIRTDASY